MLFYKRVHLIKMMWTVYFYFSTNTNRSKNLNTSFRFRSAYASITIGVKMSYKTFWNHLRDF